MVADQISTYFLLFYNLNLYVPLFTELVFTSVYPVFFSNLLSFILIFLYLFLLVYKLHTEYGSTLESTKPNLMIRYNIFVTSWLNFAGIKFESIEEAFSIIVL